MNTRTITPHTHSVGTPPQTSRTGVIRLLLCLSLAFLSTTAQAVGTFTLAQDSMVYSRSLHTTTLLNNGKILVTGGQDASGNPVGTAEIFDPSLGTWAQLTYATPRFNHTATLLPNGTVLLIGGTSDGTAAMSVTEILDPATGVVTTLATNALAGRYNHTATLVSTSAGVYKVLVTGGRTGATGTYTTSCGLYAPTSAIAGTWTTATALLTTARAYHTATLLPNGKVFVTGGKSAAATWLATAQLYTPNTTTGTWAAAAAPATARANHTATLMGNGSVLVTGGDTTGSALLATAAIYTSAGTWASAGTVPSMSISRSEHTASLLPNGSVLVIGGVSSAGVVTTSELFSPTANTWTGQGALHDARKDATSTVLPSGEVFVVGGTSGTGTGGYALDIATAELFDSTLGQATLSAGIPGSPYRDDATLTLLPSGYVLLAGGNFTYQGGHQTENDASYYLTMDASPHFLSGLATMNQTRAGHTATLLPNGKVLVAGGLTHPITGADIYLNSSELFDPAAGGNILSTTIPQGTWSTTTAQMASNLAYHTATLLQDGTVLVCGGTFGPGTLNTAEIYNPGIAGTASSGTWTPVTAPMAAYRAHHTATLLRDGRVLIWGGCAQTDPTAEIYDPVAKSWTPLWVGYAGAYGHTATLLPSGKVLIGGGWGIQPFTQQWTFTNPPLIFDPYYGTTNPTPPLNAPRYSHTATLLANGKVLVTGGLNNASGPSSYVMNTEVYDPSTNTWSYSVALPFGQYSHYAVATPKSEVLVAGGFTGPGSQSNIYSSAYTYNSGLGYVTAAQPVIGASQPLTQTLSTGLVISTTSGSSGFTGQGNTEASSGGGQNSATNYPLVQFRSLLDGQSSFLPASSAANWSSSSFTSAPISGFGTGYGMLTVFANGIPSVSKIIKLNAGNPMISSPFSSGLTISSTQLYASIDFDGGSPITARGFVFCKTSVSTTPTIGGTGVSNATNVSGNSLTTGLFWGTASGLVPSTSYSFRAYATNAQGTVYSAASTFTAITCTTFTASNPSNLTGWTGGVYSGQFNSTSSYGPVTYTLNSGTIPPGLTLDSNGNLHGIPTVTGTRPAFTVKATDSRLCTAISPSCVMSFSNCPTITVQGPTNTPLVVGNGCYLQFNQSGSASFPIQFSLFNGTLPPGISLDSSTGLISGTTTVINDYPITVQAMDSHGCFGLLPYTISVVCPSVVITNPSVTTGTLGQQLGVGNFSVPAAVNYSITSGRLPNGVSLLTLNAVAAQLIGVPLETGSFPITVTATTTVGNCVGTSLYTFNVSCPTVFVAPPPVSSCTIFTNFSQTFTASVGVTGTSFAIASGVLPAGLTLDSASGTLSGIPSQTGSFPVTVTANYYGCTGTSAVYNLQIIGNNADLTNLTLDNLTLSPVFDTRATEGYTMDGTSTATAITATAADSSAAIQVTVNGGTAISATSGTATSSLYVPNDGDTITIQVTSRDASKAHTYTVVRHKNGFRPTASMSVARGNHAAILQASSTPSTSGVLVAGGRLGPSEDWSELYNYDTVVAGGGWSTPVAVPSGGEYTTSLVAISPNNTLQITASGPCEYTSGNVNSWNLFDNPDSYWADGDTSTLLPNGTVLQVGGYGPNWIQTYQPHYYYNYSRILNINGTQYQRWTPAPNVANNLIHARAGHTATLVTDANSVVNVLAVGGRDGTAALQTTELYNTSTGSWSAAATLNSPRTLHSATLLADGRILVIGGRSLTNYLNSVEIYDPLHPNLGWVPAASMATARSGHSATLIITSTGAYKVLVTGGDTPLGRTASAELFDVALGTWTQIGSLGTRRSNHTANVLPNGLVLIAGGWGLYDPLTPWNSSLPVGVGTDGPLNGQVSCELFDVNQVTP